MRILECSRYDRHELPLIAAQCLMNIQGYIVYTQYSCLCSYILCRFAPRQWVDLSCCIHELINDFIGHFSSRLKKRETKLRNHYPSTNKESHLLEEPYSLLKSLDRQSLHAASEQLSGSVVLYIVK